MPHESLYVLDLLGTAIFAVSGALAAGRQRMDVFGVVVVAAVTAVGGGTTRDVLLGRSPVFWIQDLAYLGAIAGAALLTYATAWYVRFPEKALLVADALGLSVFTIVGAYVALGEGVHPVIAVLMGTVTGTVGGMIRDLLCGDVPFILRREIYATASLAGGTVYLLLVQITRVDTLAAMLAGAGVVFISRMVGALWGWHLPSFEPRETR